MKMIGSGLIYASISPTSNKVHQSVVLDTTVGIAIGCSIGLLSLVISFIFLIREYRRRILIRCITSNLSELNLGNIHSKEETHEITSIEDDLPD
ncbi:hypothetical protein TrispH2_003965 [Trichoplax sp. H2]|nr:hypothetical protein TrispH2_003965 [Trichoplax sp. H2]|eukprot:RDD43370.1 hypothetical protein TrispH2_003965 [Trichoplax sp. H2]